MSQVAPHPSNPKSPEVVTTNQPMHYGPPGHYPNVQHVPQPGYPQMQMAQTSLYNNTNTTVVINQQPQQQRHSHRDWSTGVCGCLEDATSCLLAWCCTPCYSCYLATHLEESCCLPMCFGPMECVPTGGYPVPWLVALRVKVREANKIKGNIMSDCCVVCCCPLCVMCQLKREYDYVQQHPE